MLPTCCGYGWLLNSPLLSAEQAINIACPAGMLPEAMNDMECRCKSQYFNGPARGCYGALNWTWRYNDAGSGSCVASGCPDGERPYYTGSPNLICNDTAYVGDVFSFFETGCQGAP